jgi:hypothetical protein
LTHQVFYLTIECSLLVIELISISINTDDDSSVASEAPVKKSKKDEGDNRSVVDAWYEEEVDSDSGSDKQSQESRVGIPSNEEFKVSNMNEWTTAIESFNDDIDDDVIPFTPSNSSYDPPTRAVTDPPTSNSIAKRHQKSKNSPSASSSSSSSSSSSARNAKRALPLTSTNINTDSQISEDEGVEGAYESHSKSSKKRKTGSSTHRRSV